MKFDEFTTDKKLVQQRRPYNSYNWQETSIPPKSSNRTSKGASNGKTENRKDSPHAFTLPHVVHWDIKYCSQQNMLWIGAKFSTKLHSKLNIGSLVSLGLFTELLNTFHFSFHQHMLVGTMRMKFDEFKTNKKWVQQRRPCNSNWQMTRNLNPCQNQLSEPPKVY